MFYQRRNRMVEYAPSGREEGVWQCAVSVSRWDSLAAQPAPGSHGGGTWTPQVCEAGPAPLRTSARPLLRDPQEKHSEIQQLHFTHRLNDSSGKLPSCDLVHLKFALCSSTALWRKKKKCAFYVCFFLFMSPSGCQLKSHVSWKWKDNCLGKTSFEENWGFFGLLSCRQDFYLLLVHIG